MRKKIVCYALIVAMLFSCISAIGVKPVYAETEDNVFYYEGHKYEIVNESMSWKEADAACMEKEGHLLTIGSKEEQEEITAQLKGRKNNKNCYWIGLFKDENAGNNWRWITGGTLDYKNWTEGEPNDYGNTGEYRGMMFGVRATNSSEIKEIGQWNDTLDNGAPSAGSFYSLSEFGYICEWDKDSENPNSYKIKYDLNGGMDNYQNPLVGTTGISYELYEPTKKERSFGGWYTTKNVWDEDAVNIDEIPIDQEEDLSLYAKWNPKLEAIDNFKILKDGLVVLVNDQNKSKVKDAKVYLDWNLNLEKPSATTNEDGIAEFDYNVGAVYSGGLIPIKVEANGYHTQSMDIKWTPGTILAITIYKDDGGAYVTSVKASYEGEDKTYDLLNQYMYFDQMVDIDRNDTGCTEEKKQHIKCLNLEIDSVKSEGIEIEEYQLVQGGKVIFSEKSDKTMKLNVYTGTEDNPQKYKQRRRIEGFVADKPVYIRVKYKNVGDTAQNSSKCQPLSLTVGSPSEYGESEYTGMVSFDGGLTITPDESIPIIGGTELSFGITELPFVCEMEGDNIKVAINVDAQTAKEIIKGQEEEGKDGDDDGNENEEKNKDGNSTIWDDIEKEFTEAKKKCNTINEQIVDSKKDGSKFGAVKEFKSGFEGFDLNAEISGYGCGPIKTKDGEPAKVEVGLIITLSEDGEWTRPYFIGYVPVFVTVTEHGEVAGEGSFEVISNEPSATSSKGETNENDQEGKFSLKGLGGSIKPYFELNVGGGVGVNEVLNVQAGGDAGLEWYNKFGGKKDDYLTLKGWFHVIAKVLMYEVKKEFAENTWDIYGNSEADAAAYGLWSKGRTIASDSVEEVDIYSSDSYEPISRDYLNAAVPLDLDTEIVKASVYPNADPILLDVDGVGYLFWLDDDGTRGDFDRSALVYATSKDYETWSEPVKVFDEADEASADLAFDVAYDDGEIHLVVCKSNRIFGDEDASLNDVAESSEIYYAMIDPSNNENILERRITDNKQPDLMPSIVADNGQVAIAYSEIEVNDGDFLSTSNNTSLAMVECKNDFEVNKVETEGLLTDLEVGLLQDNVVVANVQDTDFDYNTIKDMKLYLFNGTENNLMAASDSGVTSPTFTELDNETILMWHEDGTLFCSNGTNNEELLSESYTAFSQNFRLLEDDNGNHKIVWVSASDNEYALYATSYVEGAWSPAYKLFETECDLFGFVSGYGEGDDTCLAYVETNGLDYNQTLSNLYATKIEPEMDISITGVAYDGTEVKAGVATPITITVKNMGQKKVDSISIESEACGYRKVIDNADLGLGEEKSYDIDDLILFDDDDSLTEVDIKVTCEDDYDQENSETHFKVGYVDVRLSTEEVLVGGTKCANVTVENLTNIPTDATLQIIAESKDGPVVAESKIENLTKESNVSFIFDPSTIEHGLEMGEYYINVVTDKEEEYVSDNEEFFYTEYYGKPLYEVNVVAPEGGTLTEDISGFYPAGTVLSVTAVNDSGWEFKNWTSDEDVVIDSPNEVTTTFVVPAHDTTITANFRDLIIESSISNEGHTWYCGDTYQMKPVFESKEDFSDTLSWSSSNESIATVDNNGNVTALAKGTVTISFTSSDERVVSASSKITVNIGHIVTDLSEFESEHNYSNNSNEKWSYTVPGACSINVTFDEQTAVEKGYDHLYVYDIKGNLVGDYTGNSLSGKTINVQGDTVSIILKSDSTRKGWGFKVTAAEMIEHSMQLTDSKDVTCTENGFALYSCENCEYEEREVFETSGHVHTVNEVVAPTCTEAGYTVYKCVCGDSFSSDEVEALGHKFVNYVDDNNATCTAEGTATAVCENNCGKTDAISTEILEHTLSDWIIDKSATCTEDGYKHKECACGYKETETLPALKHDIVKHEGKAATCTAIGYDAYETCSRCDYTTYKEIPATDHSAGAEADCTTAKTCAVCGVTLDKPIGHNYKSVVTAATCTADGKTTYTCACGDEYTEVIKALGHDKVTHEAQAVTCTAAGWEAYETCSRCDYTTYSEIPATGHTVMTITVKASDKNAGEITETCDVCKAELSRETIAKVSKITIPKAAYTYNGFKRKPVVTVRDADGNKLTKGEDYTVTYKNAKNTKVVTSKLVGKYNVVIKFKGDYSGTVTKSFKINPQGTKILKLNKKGKKQFTVKWKKKNVQVTGYQIKYSTKKNMKAAKVVTVAKAKVNTKTIKQLKAKKKYWVQIRTYKTVNGKKYYSTWSNKRTVTTK